MLAMVLYLAGSMALGLNAAVSLASIPVAPAALLSHGPLGYAAWMALLMACGAPFVGLGVFAMLFFGRL